MRGAKPKPIEVHKAAGTLRPDRHARTPMLAAGRSEVPSLPKGTPAEIRAVYNSLVKRLDHILDGADAEMVEAAAKCIVRARTAAKDIEKRGMVVESRLGQVIENPSVKQERDAWTAFRQFAEQLGLGPSARARLAHLGTEGRTVTDEFDELAELRERRAAAG